MNLTFTGRHLEITDPIREYAAAKVAKLPRYFDRLQAMDIVVEKLEHSFAVEMRAQAPGHDPFIATEQGHDLYVCIDSAVDKIERQLTDHKDRIRNRKHNVD